MLWVDGIFERRVRACPRLAPGSGCGSVGLQTTQPNGVETPTILLLGSRPFGPTSLNRNNPGFRTNSKVASIAGKAP